MTDAPQPVQDQPKLDPNEPMQPPILTRGELGDVVRCIDAVRRNVEHEPAKALIALIDKLVTAKPVAAPSVAPNGAEAKPVGNRHMRRAGKANGAAHART